MGLIAVVCAGLSILQYQWTGDVSRAERARLRSGLDEQVALLVRTFDDEISDSCRALMPDPSEIRAEGIQEANRSHYQEWASSHERGLFARIGVAVPEHGTLRLYGFDGEGRMTPMKWPANWDTLRVTMAARMRGEGPPPSAPRDSTLIEAPVFDDGEGRDGPRAELEWLIFELSEDHLRSKTLPRLWRSF